MKHTPGPWEISWYTNYTGYSIWGKDIGCLAERWYPSELSEKGNTEMLANALLIAAAPRMYDALKKSADEYDYCFVCDNHPSSGHSKDCPLYEAEGDTP
jgi:hypothetical protein